jgi:hypothetical protein
MSKGPMPSTCTIVSPFTSAAWCIFAGRKWYEPAPSSWAGASIVSPMCNTKVPERIVSCSSFECQCAGIL